MKFFQRFDHFEHVGTRLGLLVPTHADELLELGLDILWNLEEQLGE